MMYGYGYGPGYGMMDGFGGWLGAGLMMFFGWLVLVGIVLLIVWLARGSGRAGGTAPPSGGAAEDRALTIARERFARGEITEEEYERIRVTLAR